MKALWVTTLAVALIAPLGGSASAGPRSVPAAPPTASVTVGPGGSPVYDPATVKVRMGGTVTWTWDSSGHSVTDTSGLDLFDSGVLDDGATFSYSPLAAATYKYSSTPDPGMEGRVRVPMKVHPTTGDRYTEFTITWAVTSQPDIWYYVKGRVGTRHWDVFNDGADLSRKRTLDPGTWQVKAQMFNINTGRVSAWSPILTVIVT